MASVNPSGSKKNPAYNPYGQKLDPEFQQQYEQTKGKISEARKTREVRKKLTEVGDKHYGSVDGLVNEFKNLRKEVSVLKPDTQRSTRGVYSRDFCNLVKENKRSGLTHEQSATNAYRQTFNREPTPGRNMQRLSENIHGGSVKPS